MRATGNPTEFAWQIVFKTRRPVPHPKIQGERAGGELPSGRPG
jgi:hypothetical protein